MKLILGIVGLFVIFGFIFIISSNAVDTIKQDQQENSTIWNQTDSVVKLQADISDLFPYMGIFVGALVFIIFMIILFVKLINMGIN